MFSEGGYTLDDHQLLTGFLKNNRSINSRILQMTEFSRKTSMEAVTFPDGMFFIQALALLPQLNTLVFFFFSCFPLGQLSSSLSSNCNCSSATHQVGPSLLFLIGHRRTSVWGSLRRDRKYQTRLIFTSWHRVRLRLDAEL